LGLEAQTTAKKVRLNPIYDMRGGAGDTVDVFGQFESQIQQRSDLFLSGLAAEPTDQPDMSDQKSGTPLRMRANFYRLHCIATTHIGCSSETNTPAASESAEQ
jgi:hypothetical protein